nr:MAG TPA: hypothetical protein [Caudoviricetes sp.]
MSFNNFPGNPQKHCKNEKRNGTNHNYRQPKRKSQTKAQCKRSTFQEAQRINGTEFKAIGFRGTYISQHTKQQYQPDG